MNINICFDFLFIKEKYLWKQICMIDCLIFKIMKNVSKILKNNKFEIVYILY